MCDITPQDNNSIAAEAMETDNPIILNHNDWQDICEIMRSLTWGREIMVIWQRLADRINKRHFDSYNH